MDTVEELRGDEVGALGASEAERVMTWAHVSIAWHMHMWTIMQYTRCSTLRYPRRVPRS